MVDVLNLEIITPKKVYLKEEVKSFTAPGVEGSFQILPNHAPFITTLVPGRVKILFNNGETKFYAVSGGTIEVHNGHITMLAEAIEAVDEIDIDRAKKAKERAEKRLKDKEAGMDLERARASLLRAINRLNISNV
jgi:F-type H+-transporting ATPase subunit epsilon